MMNLKPKVIVHKFPCVCVALLFLIRIPTLELLLQPAALHLFGKANFGVFLHQLQYVDQLRAIEMMVCKLFRSNYFMSSAVEDIICCFMLANILPGSGKFVMKIIEKLY